MKKYSIMIFNNKTGELEMEVGVDTCEFNTINQPNFSTGRPGDQIEYHTHTDVDRRIVFPDGGELLLPDVLGRDTRLDRRVMP